MKTVYFVRHGEGENNITGKYLADSAALTEKGKVQAQLVAQRVQAYAPDALLSSAMTRAYETAQIISEATKLPVEQSALFNERAQPAWLIGHPKQSEERRVWDTWCREHIHEQEWPDRDAENYFMLMERARSALEYLATQVANRVVCVTHGTFLRFMIAQVLFGDHATPHLLLRFRDTSVTHNTGITMFRFESELGWHLVSFNDHAHVAHL